MIWFTADTHFHHANILRYCNRPFRDVHHMHEALISNWNDFVEKCDTVYHLGDFSMSRKLESWQEVLQRLNGNIHLILGNHDNTSVANQLVKQRLLMSCSNYFYLREGGKRFILSHYAFRVWRGSHRGSYHLYGHSHGTLPPIPCSMDIGVDVLNYYPISIDEVVEKLSKQEYRAVDHHGRNEV